MAIVATSCLALSDGSFDVVIADPPYFLRIPEHDTLTDFHIRNNGGNPRRRLAWDKFHSWMITVTSPRSGSACVPAVEREGQLIRILQSA